MFMLYPPTKCYIPTFSDTSVIATKLKALHNLTFRIATCCYFTLHRKWH